MAGTIPQAWSNGRLLPEENGFPFVVPKGFERDSVTGSRYGYRPSPANSRYGCPPGAVPLLANVHPILVLVLALTAVSALTWLDDRSNDLAQPWTLPVLRRRYATNIVCANASKQKTPLSAGIDRDKFLRMLPRMQRFNLAVWSTLITAVSTGVLWLLLCTLEYGRKCQEPTSWHTRLLWAFVSVTSWLLYPAVFLVVQRMPTNWAIVVCRTICDGPEANFPRNLLARLAGVLLFAPVALFLVPFVITGFMFKITAVPFRWCFDRPAHDGQRPMDIWREYGQVGRLAKGTLGKFANYFSPSRILEPEDLEAEDD
ncbi:hypothetical protein ANO11243_042300 [Dothideomycetidae sp. 11243]|nr:hypothetical protein ANO11243_042300 [fungal sp. No.11243]